MQNLIQNSLVLYRALAAQYGGIDAHNDGIRFRRTPGIDGIVCLLFGSHSGLIFFRERLALRTGAVIETDGAVLVAAGVKVEK